MSPDSMDYKRASEYILDKLKFELPQYCYYHNFNHTIGVLKAVDVIAAGESVTDEVTLNLLRTAAVFHDCGFIEQYKLNEEIAARIAGEVLPQFGYTEDEIRFIQRMIMVTVLGAEPKDLHESIIKDADFFYLGEERYWSTALELKKELAEAVDTHYTSNEWKDMQVNFLTSHRFYTNTAIRLGEPVKKKHIEKIKQGLYD